MGWFDLNFSLRGFDTFSLNQLQPDRFFLSMSHNLDTYFCQGKKNIRYFFLREKITHQMRICFRQTFFRLFDYKFHNENYKIELMDVNIVLLNLMRVFVISDNGSERDANNTVLEWMGWNDEIQTKLFPLVEDWITQYGMAL